ncbi:MAG: hypothetical protein KDH08_18475, partial [Anaerolineae bacterium]|nr:hypothetical protein [Anaerolineae bacterium]
TSLHMNAEGLERMNLGLQSKLARIQRNELRWQETMTDDAEVLMVAFGTAGRICSSVVQSARRAGLKVGLLRPISLWPFPEQRLLELAERVQQILVVEMNAGQMVLDVKAAVAGRAPVHFYGRLGGVVPLPDEISQQIDKLVSQPAGAGYKTGASNGFGHATVVPAGDARAEGRI